MLEKIDLNKKMSKQEYSESLPKIEAELGRLQRECKDLDIPVMIVFEGFGASGKGLQIGKLIHSMDPRGFEVHTIKNETEEERMHPFLWRFWIKTPEKGKIAVFDGSWYRKVWVDRFEKRTREKELKDDFASINAFEQQLSEGGTLIIKLFLDIDQDEQEKESGKYIRRERYAGACQRSYYVGEDITEEDIKAEFKHGILKLFFPKKEVKPAVEEKKYISIEG